MSPDEEEADELQQAFDEWFAQNGIDLSDSPWPLTYSSCQP